MEQTTDGGYVVGGASYASSCPTGMHPPCNDQSVGIVFKTDGTGTLVWAKDLFGKQYARVYDVNLTSGGGYIVAGWTGQIAEISEEGDKKVKIVNKDVLAVKLDGSANTAWEKTLGGENDDVAYSVQQTSDGGYILAGVTGSYGKGGSDIWVLKLNAVGHCSGDSCPE